MNSDKLKPFCLFIVGPTASGKTALSLELAEYLNAEIISADSRQIYRYMDIGTATPTEEELTRVKHYFINDLDPDEKFSAGEFGVEARKIIKEKIEAGKNIIVSGGSGLYIQAIRGMISDTLSSDESVRNAILIKGDKKGWLALFEELEKIDPEYAKSIDAQNPKRVCRALEIWEMTGKKPSTVFKEQDNKFPWKHVVIGLDPDRKLLYERIDRRVLEMIDGGLIDEVKALIDKGYSADLNALNTVGYKEIIAYLDGELDKETAISEIQKNTRRFAKRQMTWFRKYSPDHWITFNQEPNLSDIVEEAKKIIVACRP
ncbi:MAG: tRNA (adenosine(37)-N6)-dimethylallyltransferase MiaA [Candidatus Marinimicrobia bacterium]|nr:tRNA (adenosine(37)-N6)-dimethylallyltransferase MiaA [Candidatus Neomarinimicrobiota bacterium]